MIFLERTRKGHCLSWNCFKGNIGDISERQGAVHVGFSEHINITLNWTERNMQIPMTHVGKILIKPFIIIIIDRFYIALFSALKQTHCTRMWFYISE